MEPVTPIRLVGVYDADGTVRGELAYFFKARIGAAHCALCDITHGPLRERADWRACRDALPLPFDTYHRDDQPEEVRAATGGITPVVVAETASGVSVLLGPDELEQCHGSPELLRQAIEAALGSTGLSV